MPGIFVSYRREDTQGDAGRICDHLTDHFGRNQVFFDIDSIPPGEDFVEHLQTKISECDILIVIVGKQWLNASDQNGVRRLDIPADFVRIEIAAALKRNIPIFPVLLNGADMPSAKDLPDELAALSRQQAIQLRYVGFRQQIPLLIQAIENKRKEQGRKRRSKFLPAFAFTGIGRIAIAGICILAIFGFYLAQHYGVPDSTSTRKPSSNGSPNLTIVCIPRCAADKNFALTVTNVGPTNLSGDPPVGVANLGVLLPEPTALKSWSLTADGNLPVPSGGGVPDYRSGNVFSFFRLASTHKENFDTFQSLSAKAGFKVSSYNAFAFGLGSFNTSGASINPIKFSGFVGAQGFPAGTVFFAYLTDNNADGYVVNRTPTENLVVVTK